MAALQRQVDGTATAQELRAHNAPLARLITMMILHQHAKIAQQGGLPAVVEQSEPVFQYATLAPLELTLPQAAQLVPIVLQARLMMTATLRRSACTALPGNTPPQLVSLGRALTALTDSMLRRELPRASTVSLEPSMTIPTQRLHAQTAQLGRSRLP